MTTQVELIQRAKAAWPGSKGQQIYDTLTALLRLDRTEAVTAANTITAEESGKTFFLNSATGFASTLPAPAAGLKYSFIVKTAPTSGNHTIVTNASANVIQGFSLVMADAAGVAAVNEDSINLVANQAVVGDRVDVESDGTNWYVVAKVSVAAACTFTAA